ncbi:dehydrodolichyl diphosphate synthase complex subunit Nus1 [Papilio machaon]|uniref:dehydrodolichyl diphosphate synthase complex subunit Nus1 n=1 Tax=Papilio machaon TaxID=76193 RepID=UPI001E663794|nr:dehydrodolichyl diphosphate synthase complex subunit Nus1 [Papilio machaon]
MLSRLIRQILFILVHFVVNILVAIQNVYHRLWVRRCKVLDDEVTKNDVIMIKKHVPKMKKSLKHLVVLVDTNHHSMSDLARLVIWSLITGIPYVSFHDITGELKQNEEKLFLAIEKKKKGIPGCIKWSNKPDLNGYTYGMNANNVFINIFSYKDGRPQIVESIRQIAKGGVDCEKKSNEFTTEEFGKVLTQLYNNIPDPDLVMYTGPHCSTYGLLPWQIRLTEFVQLSLDHSVDISSYIGALYKYNKCDQRFGK